MARRTGRAAVPAGARESILSRDTLLLLAAGFCYFSSPMLVTPLITGFTGSLGGSAALMGVVGGLMNVVSLVCRPLLGGLADRVSRYRLSLAGAACMALACALYVMAPNPAVVVVARVVNGVGFSCCSVSMSTWFCSLLPPGRVGSGMGIYGTMNALGMAVAPALGVALLGSVGYRPAFVVAALFSTAIMVLVQFVGDRGLPPRAASGEKGAEAEEDAGAEKDVGAEKGRASAARPRLVEPRVVPVALIIMLFAIPYCATQSFLVNYVAARGLAVSVSLFFPAYAVILLVLRVALRDLFDTKPFSFFVGVASVSAAVGIGALALAANDALLMVAALGLAGGYGVMSSVCQSTALKLARPGAEGLANGTYYIGLDLGMSFGPMLGGVLFGSLDAELFYPVLMLCVPAALVVYLACRRQLRRA